MKLGLKSVLKLEILCIFIWVIIAIAQSAVYQSVRYASESTWPRRTSNKYFFPKYAVQHTTEESANRNVYSRTTVPEASAPVNERRKKTYRPPKKQGFRFPDFFESPDKEESIFNSISDSSSKLEKQFPGLKPFKNYKLHKVPEQDRQALYSNGLIYLVDFRDSNPFFH